METTRRIVIVLISYLTIIYVYGCTRSVESVDMVLLKELKIQETFKIEDSYLSIKLVDIDKKANDCLLEINDSSKSKTESMKAKINQPIMKIIHVTDIKQNSVSLSIRKGYTREKWNLK
jgi:hypothetical protein